MKKQPKLYGVGVGPGDPELITIKALNAIKGADIIAFHETKTKNSNALKIVKQWITNEQKLLPLTYPVTTEKSSFSNGYEDELNDFYKKITIEIGAFLEQGLTVCVLAEGDPLFYSSFMYVYDNLGKRFATEIIPGISSVFAAAAVFQTPICYRNQSFTVLSGVLEKSELIDKLQYGDAFAIMKLGRNFEKVREALIATKLDKRALYIERATMEEQRIIALHDVNGHDSPYFSLILVPGQSQSLSEKN